MEAVQGVMVISIEFHESILRGQMINRSVAPIERTESRSGVGELDVTRPRAVRWSAPIFRWSDGACGRYSLENVESMFEHIACEERAAES